MQWEIEPKHVQVQKLKDQAPVSIQMQRTFSTVTLAKNILFLGEFFGGSCFIFLKTPTGMKCS